MLREFSGFPSLVKLFIFSGGCVTFEELFTEYNLRYVMMHEVWRLILRFDQSSMQDNCLFDFARSAIGSHCIGMLRAQSPYKARAL